MSREYAICEVCGRIVHVVRVPGNRRPVLPAHRRRRDEQWCYGGARMLREEDVRSFVSASDRRR